MKSLTEVKEPTNDNQGSSAWQGFLRYTFPEDRQVLNVHDGVTKDWHSTRYMKADLIVSIHFHEHSACLSREGQATSPAGLGDSE